MSVSFVQATSTFRKCCGLPLGEPCCLGGFEARKGRAGLSCPYPSNCDPRLQSQRLYFPCTLYLHLSIKSIQSTPSSFHESRRLASCYNLPLLKNRALTRGILRGYHRTIFYQFEAKNKASPAIIRAKYLHSLPDCVAFRYSSPNYDAAASSPSVPQTSFTYIHQGCCPIAPDSPPSFTNSSFRCLLPNISFPDPALPFFSETEHNMQYQHHDHVPHHEPLPQAPPPPPPPPGMRSPFPDMAGLANGFGRVHLEPNAHHFEHNMHQPAIQVIQPPRYDAMPDPRSFTSNGKPPIGYVGYIFAKQPVEHVGHKETWAIIHKERMPASQADLKNQIEKNRKRDVTGLDQYMHRDMKGFKRKQIDELIRECVAMDSDPRFEYTIASIKRDTRRRQSGALETSNMQVILKRQARKGMEDRGPFTSFSNTRLPSSGVVDLSGASGTEDYERSSQNSSNGHRPGVNPFGRPPSDSWMPVGHPEPRPQPQHTHSHESAQPDNFAHYHADHGNQHAHGLEEPIRLNHGHPLFGEEHHDDKHGHEHKTTKHKEKEHKPPKIINEKHKSHNVHHEHSGSSTSFDSDSSSGDTDRTPDTVISSEGSRYHYKDKKYQKKKHHRKSSSHDHEHEPIKKIYREHRRKEPTPKRRVSSPPPPQRFRYRHEDVYVEPGFTSHRRPEPSYTRERIPYHHRAMSYDDERLHDHDMRGLGRRPTVYSRRITGAAHPVELYDDRAERRRHDMLDREIREREDAARMREKARREMADLERMYHAPPRPRMDRMHDYHDDHLHRYHDDRY